MIKNLPFRIKPEEIIEFFEGYGRISNRDAFIESQGGRNTGNAIVIFESEGHAQDAKDALDGSDLGGRKAFLKDHTHHDMRNACNL